MKHSAQNLLLVFAMLASMGAYAQDSLLGKARSNTFSYTYVDAAFIDIDEIDVNGLRIKGSFSFDPNLSAISSLTFAGKRDVDLEIASLGLSYHQKIEKTELSNADFLTHASLERYELTVDNVGAKRKKVRDHDNGLLIGAGMRVKVVQQLEVFSDLSYRTAGDNDFLFSLGGRYSVTPEISLNAALVVSDNDEINLGARYTF